MIKSVTVTNYKHESLTLELSKPETSGLIVANIDGLGPNKADISSNELATMDGSIFTSARVPSREITLTLAMLEIPSVEANRLKTYRYFPLKKRVTLRVKTDARDAEITGYVESNEPEIFSKLEATKISILCPDPNFYEAGEDRSMFSGVQPLFEFPFSNESLTEPLIEFGEIRLDTRAILDYLGDADTGVYITIHALGDAENITLFNADTYETMKIDTTKLATISGAPFTQGDDILISTVKGNKYARLLRQGSIKNIIGALDKDSDWFQLTAGTNIFGFTAESGEADLMVTFTYKNAYGGI